MLPLLFFVFGIFLAQAAAQNFSEPISMAVQLEEQNPDSTDLQVMAEPSQGRAWLKCHGTGTNSYVGYDRILTVIDEFCELAEQQMYPDDNTESIGRIYSRGVSSKPSLFYLRHVSEPYNNRQRFSFV